MNGEPIDFLDFGASEGGSIEFARKHLGGRRGLGIDIRAQKVEVAREHGYQCVQADVTRVPFPDRSVRFVTMSHLLEHLPSLAAVEATLREGARVARDFLFIQGPYFDADAELDAQGLRFYWSFWTGHRCHLKSWELSDILLRIGLEDHMVFVAEPIYDSSHLAIHPLPSPRDQHAYDPAVHPPKPLVKFKRPVFREIVCYVQLQPLPNWDEILTARQDCIPLDTLGRVEASEAVEEWKRGA